MHSWYKSLKLCKIRPNSMEISAPNLPELFMTTYPISVCIFIPISAPTYLCLQQVLHQLSISARISLFSCWLVLFTGLWIIWNVVLSRKRRHRLASYALRRRHYRRRRRKIRTRVVLDCVCGRSIEPPVKGEEVEASNNILYCTSG